MTPEEKAKELFNKFCYEIRTEDRGDGYFTNVIQAKQCALIAVDETLNVFIEVYVALQIAGLLKFSVEETATYKFWQEVKQEIKKI